VAMVAGLRMSHSRMVLSCEPVITCALAGRRAASVGQDSNLQGCYRFT